MEGKQEQIHKWYVKELELLETARISPRNKEMIIQFRNHVGTTGSGKRRITKLSSQLRKICIWNGSIGISHNLDELTKSDLTALITHINSMTARSNNTKADYKRCIKQFYNFFEDEDPRVEQAGHPKREEARKFYKYLKKQVKIGYKDRQADPRTILSDEDILTVIENGCNNSMEKALISLLDETGCRRGEFLALKVGSLEFKETHCTVTVPDGKSGMRTIQVIRSVPYLLRYLETHPFKLDLHSSLWISQSNNMSRKPLQETGMVKLLQRTFDRAGITKDVKKRNPHWFRHSRATKLAPKLTEVMLCKYMGWTLGSKQVKRYVHLCAKDLEDMMLKIHGIKQQEDVEVPIKCVCKHLNVPTDSYCAKCYRPLKQESFIQEQELRDSEIGKTMDLLREIMSDPKLLKDFSEFRQRTVGGGRASE